MGRNGRVDRGLLTPGLNILILVRFFELYSSDILFLIENIKLFWGGNCVIKRGGGQMPYSDSAKYCYLMWELNTTFRSVRMSYYMK
jgi:hypothetical protein